MMTGTRIFPHSRGSDSASQENPPVQHARFLLSLQLSLHFQLRGDGFLLLPQPNLQGLLFLSRTTVCLIIGLLHRREQGNHSGNGGHSSAGAGEGNEGQGKPLGCCTPTTHLNLHVCAGGISGSATVDFLLYLRHTANLCLYIEKHAKGASDTVQRPARRQPLRLSHLDFVGTSLDLILALLLL